MLRSQPSAVSSQQSAAVRGSRVAGGRSQAAGREAQDLGLRSAIQGSRPGSNESQEDRQGEEGVYASVR